MPPFVPLNIREFTVNRKFLMPPFVPLNIREFTVNKTRVIAVLPMT
jgi:hypothetical protein